ncbi:MAG TPA: tripartite tricarboxylate transporter TctB family protein [Acetobacteraceae bacterium]|nr:tripartite tricarboxylate transporter TctB family protein [Acetobacteraceae bacterium]
MAALNAALNLLWVALGLAMCWQSLALGLSGPGGPGSGLFPLLAGMLIAGPGIAMLLAQLLRGGGAAMRGEELTPRFWMARGAALRVALMVAVSALMILGIPHLGFILAGVLGIPLLFRTVAPEAPWWFAVLVGALASAAVHLLFAIVLGTPLPRGPLGF